MSIFGSVRIAFARRRELRRAAAADDRHTVVSGLSILAGPGLPGFRRVARRGSDARDQQARRDVRRGLRLAAADADRAVDLGLGDPLAPMRARHSAAVLGVRLDDGAVSGPAFERLVDRRRGELLVSDLAADRAADRAEAVRRVRRRRRRQV